LIMRPTGVYDVDSVFYAALDLIWTCIPKKSKCAQAQTHKAG